MVRAAFTSGLTTVAGVSAAFIAVLAVLVGLCCSDKEPVRWGTDLPE